MGPLLAAMQGTVLLLRADKLHPAWSYVAGALLRPNLGLQGSTGLGLPVTFAALLFWLPSFDNKNILKYPHPMQDDVVLTLALLAEKFVRWLTWLTLRTLWKCLFVLN